MKQRLHKVLAHCGVGSRRECEKIIQQGRVQVDGRVVTKVGTQVEPHGVELKVDGERVQLEERVYYLLNKPRGYLSTSADTHGRPQVIDLIRDQKRRLYTVGRLDEHSEGLILVTNDGELANVICHPRYQVDKTYRITVNHAVQPDQLTRIEEGVWLAEGKTSPTSIRKIERKGKRTLVTVTIWEGRNRELRRIFAKVGLRVTNLERIAIGPLRSEGLPVGRYVRLQSKDLDFARERLRPGWKPLPVAPRRALKDKDRRPKRGGRPLRRGQEDEGRASREGPRGPSRRGPRGSRGRNGNRSGNRPPRPGRARF